MWIFHSITYTGLPTPESHRPRLGLRSTSSKAIINTEETPDEFSRNNVISSHVKTSPDHCCGYVISLAFCTQWETMRRLLGPLDAGKVASTLVLKNNALVRCCYSWNIFQLARSCNIIYLSSWFHCSIFSRCLNDVMERIIKSKNGNLTNWRQLFMRLSCYWSWISS